MVGRILAIFLIFCLALIYSINSYSQTSKLNFADITSLQVGDTGSKVFQANDPQNSQALHHLVDWFNSGHLQNAAVSISSNGLTTFTWTLKDGRLLKMYMPQKFQGYFLVKDYKLPLVYKLAVEQPPDSLQAFEQPSQQ